MDTKIDSSTHSLLLIRMLHITMYSYHRPPDMAARMKVVEDLPDDSQVHRLSRPQVACGFLERSSFLFFIGKLSVRLQGLYEILSWLRMNCGGYPRAEAFCRRFIDALGLLAQAFLAVLRTE